MLAAIYRSARRALVPLIPVLMATGWSGLVVAALGVAAQPDVGDAGRAGDRDRDRVQRDPLGALRERARAGLSVGEALRRTYLRTGAAVLASGVTAIAGFASWRSPGCRCSMTSA